MPFLIFSVKRQPVFKKNFLSTTQSKLIYTPCEMKKLINNSPRGKHQLQIQKSKAQGKKSRD